MPNHFHGIIHIPENYKKNINTIISNAKRFLSYEIVKRLKNQNEISILMVLKNSLSGSDLKKNQKHRVFRYSFDCKEIFDIDMMRTKVDYIHKKSNQGKWNLAKDYLSYAHSSAAFYELDKENEHVKSYIHYL